MLPDPYYEKEITTHLTLWREKKEASLTECAKNCQEAGILKIYLTMPSYFFLQDSDDLKVGRWDVVGAG